MIVVVVGSLATEVVVLNESVISKVWFGTVVGNVVGSKVGRKIGNVISKVVVRMYVTSIGITYANASEHIPVYRTLNQSDNHIRISQNKRK